MFDFEGMWAAMVLTLLAAGALIGLGGYFLVQFCIFAIHHLHWVS